MYNNGEKFRCHIFSMFEKIGKTVTGLLAILILNLIDEENIKELKNLMDNIKNGTGSFNDKESLWLSLAIIGITVLLIIYLVTAYVGWRKTYITVKDNTIYWEKNVLASINKAISIANISNINLEQNVIQRILGISTVKLDTNSKSTAESTDFSIILKKGKAEEFKIAINQIIDDIKYGSDTSVDNQTMTEEINSNIDEEANNLSRERGKVLFEIEATKDEVISHGILNLNIISILATVVVIGFIVWATVCSFIDNVRLGEIVTSIGTVAVIGLTCIGEIYRMLRQFFKYFNYKIKRVDDKIYMSHGFFDKTEYTIPVDKINAVIIKQSLFARIFHKFRVDIVNVGMGDDKDEKESFLLLYDTEENIFNKLADLLPEFDMEPNLRYTKQPKGALKYKLIYTVAMTILWMIIPFGIGIFAPETGLYVAVGIGVISLLTIIGNIISMFTQGVSIEDKYIKLVSGTLERSYTWIGYDKVEILKLQTNKLANNYGITKGCIYILAQLLHSTYIIPFMSNETAAKLKEKVFK